MVGGTHVSRSHTCVQASQWLCVHMPVCVLCLNRAAAGEDEGEGEAAGVAAAAPAGPWRLLGVDCEMCATSDNDKELLQVAVVDEQDELVMQVTTGGAEGNTMPRGGVGTGKQENGKGQGIRCC